MIVFMLVLVLVLLNMNVYIDECICANRFVFLLVCV
jgi:hypothetical protein